MSKAISEESQKQQGCIYDLLPEARALHTKSIAQPKSAYQFVGDSAPNLSHTEQTEELMENIAQDRNISTHQIGSSLAQIFKEPIYQSYQEVSRSEDNNRFATCTVSNDSLQTMKAVQNKAAEQSLLIFESRFESGNLAFVSRSVEKQNYYYLALQRDTNSLATCQWYYFYVENRENLGTYTFNILNLIKTYSAYQNGMKPCVLSVESGLGWRRQGFNIGYQKNSIPFRGERFYYSLQFSYNFANKNDRVYFAYSYPYTFTKLQNFINEVQSNYPNLLQTKVLTKTLRDNPVNILSITNPRPHTDPQHKRPKKDLIMICARVHPGETNSSFACQGLIKFLLSDSEEANSFRNHFIIKIVPFLNPDGVIHGNYRTSLSGHDLNRRWKRPDKNLHPQICAIKKYLYETSHKKALFIDIHGHSKKRSSFMYGCLNKQNPYLCKELPFILSKNGHHFCYFNCNFSTPAARQGTSRINVWKQFKVDYSYTMQISFCGPVRSRTQFMIKDYIKIGAELGNVISTYFCGKVYNTNEVSSNKINNLLKELYSQKELLDQGLEQSSGSESGDEEKTIPQNDKKQEKLTISNKQSTVQLNGILTKYLNETKTKWTKRDGMKSHNYKSEQRAQSNIRIRKELAPSRISIQKIDLSQQVINPYYNFGFIRGNARLTSREMRGKQSLSRLSHKNSYGPYSSNKAKLSQKPGEQYSLMLPKVLRQEQLKYRRYRKNECKFEISLNYEQIPGRHSTKMGNPQTSRQISLAEKILQTTQRQFQQSGRYWIRNS